LDYFLFASTCSNYGKVNLADEKTDLNPLGVYARSKVEAEKVVYDAGYTVLRFATAYGLSPRMRFDTLANSLSRDATVKGEIELYNPNVYRPFIHVHDLTHAIWTILSGKAYGDLSSGHNLFNVGGINCTKMMLAEKLLVLIPGLRITTCEGANDKRDYKVDFSRIRRLGFIPRIVLSTGMHEVITAIQQGVIASPQDTRWQNI